MSREITRKKRAKRALEMGQADTADRPASFATFTALAGLRLLSMESESSGTYLSVFGLSFRDFVTRVNACYFSACYDRSHCRSTNPRAKYYRMDLLG